MATASKFKNIFAEPQKEVFNYVDLNTVSTDGRLLAVNGTFLAMSWNANGGCVCLVDSTKPCSIKPDTPLIRGHKSPVIDLEFCPFRTDLLATGSEDATVKLWQIPEGGLKETLTKECQLFAQHTKKVPFVTFNPVASDVIASSSNDGSVHIWNTIKGESYTKMEVKDIPTSTEWNYNGSLLGVCSKNKLLNVIDPRAKKFVLTNKCHDSVKPYKFTWTGENTLVSLGFSKTNAKEFKGWDIRKVKEDLSCDAPVFREEIDHSSTVTTPFYDYESKLLYTMGKGEGMIHFYDLSGEKPKAGLHYTSNDSAASVAMFDRKNLDYNKCEVDRFAKYTNKKSIIYVSVYVPRKNPGYEPEIYPPVKSGEPALTYDQWVGGENKDPITKEINQIENKFVSGSAEFVKQEAPVEKSTKEKISDLEKQVAELEGKISALTTENEQLKKQVEEKNKPAA